SFPPGLSREAPHGRAPYKNTHSSRPGAEARPFRRRGGRLPNLDRDHAAVPKNENAFEAAVGPPDFLHAILFELLDLVGTPDQIPDLVRFHAFPERSDGDRPVFPHSGGGPRLAPLFP